MNITGIAILNRDVHPRDCVRQTKNFLVQFKSPQGMKRDSEVYFEILPSSLVHDTVRIRYTNAGVWTELAYVHISDLKDITFNPITF